MIYTLVMLKLLTVLEAEDKWGNQKAYFKCDCGKEFLSWKKNIARTKRTKCFDCSVRWKSSIKHNMTNTRQYKIWCSMKARCHNKNNTAYKDYGERGIFVCEKWGNSFEEFWKDMRIGYADYLTLERVDNNKGYSLENCRWATWTEQANNRRGIGILITHNGLTMNLNKWSKKLGISRQAVQQKYRKYGTIFNEHKLTKNSASYKL